MRTNFRRHPESGLTIIELAVSITIFTTIALAVAFTLTGGIEHRRLSRESYLAINAMRDVLAEIQDVANQPQDLVNQLGIGAIYDRYHGTSRAISGTTGTIAFTIYADEPNVPSFLGGARDLNFDGDAGDNHVAANGTDLRIIPLRITMTIGLGKSAQVVHIDRLITKTVQ